MTRRTQERVALKMHFDWLAFVKRVLICAYSTFDVGLPSCMVPLSCHVQQDQRVNYKRKLRLQVTRGWGLARTTAAAK